MSQRLPAIRHMFKGANFLWLGFCWLLERWTWLYLLAVNFCDLIDFFGVVKRLRFCSQRIGIIPIFLLCFMLSKALFQRNLGELWCGLLGLCFKALHRNIWKRLGGLWIRGEKVSWMRHLESAVPECSDVAWRCWVEWKSCLVLPWTSIPWTGAQDYWQLCSAFLTPAICGLPLDSCLCSINIGWITNS